jgi:RNA polymerase sigma-70 factor (ECF subfamily)
LGLESIDDEALVARFVAGGSEAFEQLMRRHEDRIFGLAYRITGDREDALEATQETFITLFRRARSFKGEAKFGTWLYRIAINAARDVLRKNRRAPPPVDPMEPAPGPVAYGAPLDDTIALRADLRRALDALAEDYREAVVLHDLCGLPYDEIARSTGVALGTVKSRISRGRRQLAEHLEHRPDVRASKDRR